MIRGQRASPAQQVSQTRLMQRCGEAAIRRPPISHQDAVEVGAQDLGRVGEATPLADPIHHGLRRRVRPQPVPHRADAPAGLVGADDGAPADLCTQGGVRRRSHPGRAMQHVHEASGRHRQPEALLQERGHLRERHADLFVQARNQRDGARPQVDVGGPHRVRALQRMSALHAAPTLCALPDGHIEAPDDRSDEGEILLVLWRDVPQLQRPATPRTRRGERGRVGRINPGGNRATRPAPIRTAGPPPAAALGPIFGERRGLTEPRAPRGTEQLGEALVLSFQPIPLTLPPIPLALEPISLAPRLCQLVPQTREFFIGASDQLVTRIVRGMRAFISHARFMADSRQKYKYIIGLFSRICG